jgi:hypothetical protein
MGNSNVVTNSSIPGWIEPSALAIDVKDYVKSRSGAKDTLEGVITVFDWMSTLGWHKDFANHASSQLEPIKQGLAIPGFLEALGDVRNKWHVMNHTDDRDATLNFTTSTAVASLNFCESAMALDSWGVISLKEGMKAAKTGFWASIGFLDVVSFFKGLGNVTTLRDRIDRVEDAGKKNILQHRLQHSFMSVLKATCTIAMAGIALTSLLFASIAHGFLFSPIVFLSLASAWLVLEYTTHFYGKMIDRWTTRLHQGQV